MHVWPVVSTHPRADLVALLAQLHSVLHAPLRGCAKSRATICWLCSAAAGLTHLATVGLCHGEPLTLAVSVDNTGSDHECADRLELVEKIKKVWPKVTLEQNCGSECLQVAVEFNKIEQHYQARLEFRGLKPGERLLSDHGHDCTALEDAVAVTIGLLLDSEVDQGRSVPQPRAQRAAPTIKISQRSIELRPPAAQGGYWSGSVQLGREFGVGSTDSTSLALNLARRFGVGWQLQTTMLMWLPATTRYAGGHVDVSLLAGALQVCRVWGQNWQLGPCVAASIGRLHGAGRGYAESSSSNLLWTAGGAAVVLERPLGHGLMLGFQGSAWLPTSRLSYSIENLGTAWSSPHIWTELAARLGVRFR
jgi:hypothetical protein